MAHRSAADEARILSRRSKVAALVCQGTTDQFAICERLGMDASQRSTISGDLKAIKEAWRASAIRDFDEARGQELARLEVVEREAWAAFERSKSERTSSRSRRRSRAAATGSPAGSDDEDELKKEQRDGDSRWLAVVLDCVRQRVALLGLGQAPVAAPGSYVPLVFVNVVQRHEQSAACLDASPAATGPAPNDGGGQNGVRLELP